MRNNNKGPKWEPCGTSGYVQIDLPLQLLSYLILQNRNSSPCFQQHVEHYTSITSCFVVMKTHLFTSCHVHKHTKSTHTPFSYNSIIQLLVRSPEKDEEKSLLPDRRTGPGFGTRGTTEVREDSSGRRKLEKDEK